MMDIKSVTLRCKDNAEAVVFNRYKYDGDYSTDYEINVEDSYIGGEYKGFFGRIKRAWAMFKAEPVAYTGIYCEDKEKMRKFLVNCLELIDEENEA